METRNFFEVNGSLFSRAQLALYLYLQAYGKDQTKQDVAAGRVKIDPLAMRFRLPVAQSASGNVVLIDTTTKHKWGSVPPEFDSGFFRDGINLAVERIAIGFVEDATAANLGKPELIKAFNNVISSWPVALRNGRLTISQKGATKCSIEAATCGVIANPVDSHNDYGFIFDSPMILSEIDPIKVELRSPDGVNFSAPAGGNHIEIELYGAMVRPQ